ncbi:hypothetical protein LCD36_20370, partial [Saccharopolyspora sp. 6T]|uniref:hypothetical protein n=1 Tax=Saccharopolyspora sp. 6T TaxID=2877238 RepID=UPI001CD7F507
MNDRSADPPHQGQQAAHDVTEPSPRAKSRRLNTRQQQYLNIVFELDQQAERDQRRRWHQGLPRQPADQWRWIPYATRHTHASPTPAQQALKAQGILSAGSGSTLAALTRRGLLDIRETTIDSIGGTVRQTQLRLTTTGRHTARFNRPRTEECPAPV